MRRSMLLLLALVLASLVMVCSGAWANGTVTQGLSNYTPSGSVPEGSVTVGHRATLTLTGYTPPPFCYWFTDEILSYYGSPSNRDGYASWELVIVNAEVQLNDMSLIYNATGRTGSHASIHKLRRWINDDTSTGYQTYTVE